MLVLSRFVNEKLIFDLGNGDKIEIMVTHVTGNKVKLGTTAPDYVAIIRSELLEDGVLLNPRVRHPEPSQGQPRSEAEGHNAHPRSRQCESDGDQLDQPTPLE